MALSDAGSVSATEQSAERITAIVTRTSRNTGDAIVGARDRLLHSPSLVSGTRSRSPLDAPTIASQLNRWFLTRRKGLVQRGKRAAAARRRTDACRPLGAIHRTEAPHPKVCDAKKPASVPDAR